MKVVIVEDEHPAAQKLERLLNELDQNIEIVQFLCSVEEAINWFSSKSHPDLIFMDIQLSDGICFEILENCNIDTPIIFTTAYNEYTLKAFKVNSVDYLLKPIDVDELNQAIIKYRQLHQSSNNQKIEEILKQFQAKKKERFLIKVGERFKSIEVNTIHCIFIEQRCTFIQNDKGKNFAIDYSLEKVENMIDNQQFFRINRNMMVSYYAIKDIIIYSSNRLKIELQNWHLSDTVLVSRERVQDFKKWMDR